MNSATKQRGCGNKDLWLKTKVYILRQSAAYEMRHSMKAKKKKKTRRDSEKSSLS